MTCDDFLNPGEWVAHDVRSLPILSERPMPDLQTFSPHATATARKPDPKVAPEPIPNRAAFSLKEAGALLGGASVASLYRWASQGKIRLTKVGGRTLVSASEIQRLIAGEAA